MSEQMEMQERLVSQIREEQQTYVIAGFECLKAGDKSGVVKNEKAYANAEDRLLKIIGFDKEKALEDIAQKIIFYKLRAYEHLFRSRMYDRLLKINRVILWVLCSSVVVRII